MPILGIYASQMSGHLYSNSYESISTVTVGAGGSSTITFSSIPTGYTHLQIRGIARCSAGTGTNAISYQFNGATGSVYSVHRLNGNGTSAAATGYATQTEMFMGDTAPTSSTTANAFGAFVLDLLDYNNTNKYKTVRALSGTDLNGSGVVTFTSGLYQATTAVSSISLYSGNPFAQYSSFALYGVK